MKPQQSKENSKPQPDLIAYLEKAFRDFRAEEHPDWHLLENNLGEAAPLPKKASDLELAIYLLSALNHMERWGRTRIEEDWDNPKSKRRAWLLPENPEDQPDLAEIVEAYGTA